jgi:hypothetical protein
VVAITCEQFLTGAADVSTRFAQMAAISHSPNYEP